MKNLTMRKGMKITDKCAINIGNEKYKLPGRKETSCENSENGMKALRN
jgi:hypothetical protein